MSEPEAAQICAFFYVCVCVCTKGEWKTFIAASLLSQAPLNFTKKEFTSWKESSKRMYYTTQETWRM